MKVHVLLILCTFIFLSSCTAEHEKYSTSLISIDQFQELSSSSFLLIDLRKPDEYSEGHIPGAHNVWRTDIQDNSKIEGLMASSEKIETLISTLGATPETTIILYDSKGNPDAARFWWILHYYGHTNVMILDGGMVAWQLQKLSISSETTLPTPAQYHFPDQPNISRYASKEMVMKALDDTNVVMIDARSTEEYRGEVQKGNAQRAGRIPGSISIDYTQTIDYQNGSKLKPIEELTSIYAHVPPSKTIIAYCQSGVRSAHTTFILTELLGYTNVMNYDGSWLEWSADTTLPVTQDIPRL